MEVADRLRACLVVAACLSTPAAAAEEPGTDWPTAGHDMQRTSYGPACPAPPYQFRWAWASGKRVGVKTLKYGRRWIAFEQFPDFATARFAPIAQPMVRGGVAYVGSAEGAVYAIDAATGETEWKAPASGPIMHCATVTDDFVVVGTLRGIDAFDLDGERRWTFADPHYGAFYACPAVDGNLVLIGGTSGHFFAIDAKTGRARWQYDTGAPIYHTPAVHEGVVYFGSESMHAFALEAGTGKLKWKSPRLHGHTFLRYWPVVAAKRKVVMFRTASLMNNLKLFGVVDKAPFEHDKAQRAFKEWMAKHPAARSLFILDLADGSERTQVASGQFGHGGDLAPPPIVYTGGSAAADAAGLKAGDVLAFYYSKQGTYQVPSKYAGWGDAQAPPVNLGVIDFETGLFRNLGPPGSRGPISARWDDFPQALMAGGTLFQLMTHGSGGFCYSMPIGGKGRAWQMSPGQLRRAMHRAGKTGGLINGSQWGGSMPPIPTRDVLLMNVDGAFIVAYESKSGK